MKDILHTASQYFLTKVVQLTYAVRGYLERIFDTALEKKNAITKPSCPLVQTYRGHSDVYRKSSSRWYAILPKLVAGSNGPPNEHWLDFSVVSQPIKSWPSGVCYLFCLISRGDRLLTLCDRTRKIGFFIKGRWYDGLTQHRDNEKHEAISCKTRQIWPTLLVCFNIMSRASFTKKLRWLIMKYMEKTWHQLVPFAVHKKAISYILPRFSPKKQSPIFSAPSPIP